jgi:twitching motility protein PilT
MSGAERNKIMGERSLAEVHIDELLVRVVDTDDGTLYLRHGLPPFTILRDGHPQGEMSEYAALYPIDLQMMVFGILTDDQIRQFEREGTIDFSYTVGRIAKFAVHFIRSSGGMEAEFRREANLRAAPKGR